MSGIRYYEPDVKGWITNIARRKIHITTNTGGADKIIFIYRFECDICDHTTTAAGLAQIRKAADIHKAAEHVDYWREHGRITPQDGSDHSESPPF